MKIAHLITNVAACLLILLSTMPAAAQVSWPAMTLSVDGVPISYAIDALFADVVSGDALAAFDGLEVPIVAINADLWPTDVEANRRHIDSYDAVIVEDADHFLHMAEPESFNRELDAVVTRLLEARATAH